MAGKPILYSSNGVPFRVTSDGFLTPLERPPVCHGWQYGCLCAACKARIEARDRKPVRQPWEPRKVPSIDTDVESAAA